MTNKIDNFLFNYFTHIIVDQSESFFLLIFTKLNVFFFCFLLTVDLIP